MPKREPFDLKSPEAKRLRDEIVHGTFVKEGTLVAFPLCFPGDSTPIPPDESHIAALDVAANWMVYGGTSGHQAHLFVGMFHGATGTVVDMGAVEGATGSVAMCCGTERFVAFVNGPGGGRAIARRLQGLPFDLLQEWGFSRQPYDDLGEIVPGERVVHAVALPSRKLAVGLTEGHLFTVALDDGTPKVVAELDACGRIAVGPSGHAVGLDAGDALWRFDAATGELELGAIPLPDGAWGQATRWARDPADGRLFAADEDGRLFALTEAGGFSDCLGQTRHAPVGAMAVTRDGRLFGCCGEGICRFFGHDPAVGEVADIGCAVSVLERRRYGYQFADAVVGRDGQLYFGEDDDLGHLWIYFPSIRGA